MPAKHEPPYSDSYSESSSGSGGVPQGSFALTNPEPANGPDAVDRLWALQGELRAEVGADARGLKLNEARRERVQDRLDDGNSEADCEHVLRVYASEAKKSGSLEWFNGETNWRKDNFDRALGRTLPRVTAVGTPTKPIAIQSNWRGLFRLAAHERQMLEKGQTPPWWTLEPRWRMTHDLSGEALIPVKDGRRTDAA